MCRNFLESRDVCFSYRMVGKFPSTGLRASFFGCFRQELADLVFAERRHLVPGGFSTPSVVVYGQKERGSWGFRFFSTVAFENLEILDWALLCSRGKYFRIKMSQVWTFQSLASLALSFCQPNQLKISLPVSGSICSSKSPQQSFRLSSLALNPKWSEKNHHSVRWSASGLWKPKAPLSNNFSSSSLVNSRQGFGLFPRPCFTRFFLLAANTSLERQNSSSLRILKDSFNSFRRHWMLLWKLERLSGSYSAPFCLRTSYKKFSKQFVKSISRYVFHIKASVALLLKKCFKFFHS